MIEAGEFVELAPPGKLRGCLVRAGGRYAAVIDTDINGGGFERPAWGTLAFDPVTARFLIA